MSGQKFSSILYSSDVSAIAEPVDARNTIPGGVNFDPAGLLAVDAVKVTVATAGAAAAATSIPLTAAIGKGDRIPSGTIINFGGAKYATLTAEAKEGDTALTVLGLTAALVANDTATYPGVGLRTLYGGTVVGRTAADRTSGAAFKLAVDAHDDLYVSAFTYFDIDGIKEITLLRHGAMLFRKGLRNYDNLNATTKGKLENWYQMID